jgi:hypothetical protein
MDATEEDATARVLAAMTDRAQQVLAADESSIYELTLDAGAYFMNLFERGTYAGSAYCIWMELSDLVDDPRGPQSDAVCLQIARKASLEWLGIDQASPVAVDGYFIRWQTSAWDEAL